MSFTEEKRDIIKVYILEKILGQQKDFVKRTAEAFQISLNTVYRYIRELENEKLIEKVEPKTYRLVEKYEMISLKRSLNELIEEDAVYDKYIAKFIKELPDNVQRIWQYSFMEICYAFKKRAVAIFGDLSGKTWVSENDKRWDTICPDRKTRRVSA